MYPFPASFPRVPASDACGTVISAGSKVIRFSNGQKVCTLFNQGHIAGPMTRAISATGLGGSLDGTLRQYAVFPESLVLAPATLNAIEASTLPCAQPTAWNSLYGLTDRALRPGDIVLTQGTGGVSIAALQFAVAAGATVIATTSSASKAKKLKKLGAHHVINYKDNSNWGEEAMKLTPGGEG
jgi:NADPH:quinone reductase-like Zn-dependent oxidoreductase